MAATKQEHSAMVGLVQQQGGQQDLSKIKCFACQQFGHYKANCPNRTGTNAVSTTTTATTTWKKVAPKEGESDTKVVEGTSWYWCGQCARYNKSHKTGAHGQKDSSGKLLTEGSPPPGGGGTTTQANVAGLIQSSGNFGAW
jgi:hypothetical protein